MTHTEAFCMLNKSLLPILLAIGVLQLPVHAGDEMFDRINQQALEQFHRKPAKSGARERKQAIATGKVLKADVENLSPGELVDLISRCKQKVHETPSNSHHERYSDYFIQAILFSIGRLGEQKTEAAK